MARARTHTRRVPGMMRSDIECTGGQLRLATYWKASTRRAYPPFPAKICFLTRPLSELSLQLLRLRGRALWSGAARAAARS
eukprot:2660120-Prymnesium_polylepis.1